MNCKNCNNNLRTDYSFCPDCGAKIIRNRLTVKNLWHDITERFFNLDNTILKTFWHLFSKPEIVIKGYIDGVRKKYMNPIGYLTISLVLSGLAFLILKEYYGVQLTETIGDNTALSTKIDKMYDYQSLMAYTSIPIYALLTWIFYLNKAKYNYTEHLVINIYIVAQYSILQFLILIPLFGIFDINFSSFSLWTMLFVLIYQFYIFKKLHHEKLIVTILKALGYGIMMTLTITIVYMVLLILILLVTGEFNMSDFIPKKA